MCRWLHSPADPTPSVRRQLDELGTVEHIVASNNLHKWWAPAMKEANPNAILYSNGTIAKAINANGVLGDGYSSDPHVPDWIDEIDYMGDVDGRDQHAHEGFATAEDMESGLKSQATALFIGCLCVRPEHPRRQREAE